MTSGANGEWVRQGTPHDDNADWNEEQSEYGTAMSPTEWDDYSSEQSVPVEPPRAHADGDLGIVGTAGSPGSPAGSPGSPAERDHEPVPGQEPDAGDEYRSEQVAPDTGSLPALDADEARPEPSGSTPEMQDNTGLENDAVADEPDAGMTRPRPLVTESVAEAAPTAVAADTGHVADATVVPLEGQRSGDERHIEAAEYLAVDPEPVASVQQEEVAQGTHDIPVDPISAVVVEPLPADVDDEPTQHVDTHDMEATQAIPVAAAAVGGTAVAASAHTGSVPDGLYRSGAAEETAVITEGSYPNQDADVEEERLQAQLEAERQAREQRLGAVPTSSDNAIREDAGPVRVSTDRFFPSFGLFVLRIVLAGVLGLTSFQILGSGVDATANFLGGYPLIPEPRLVAWILGFTLGAMALLLVIGLLQRVVGFLLLVISVCSLVFIRWGNFAIFTKDVEGFIGDKDLLLAAIGLVLLTIGGGAWGIDGAFRRARAASKAERQG